MAGGIDDSTIRAIPRPPSGGNQKEILLNKFYTVTMKRFFIMAMAAVVTMCAAATQRFYIEDFSIRAGETATVAILLDNEIEFTAFQADLYFPEGLTPVDGTYALTSRKSSSHTLSAIYQTDGALRMMSYSMQVKPFAGNSGALVTFDVAASEDFAGGNIELRGILFTTVMGVEVPFGNEVCAVGLRPAILRGDVDLDGVIGIADASDLIDYILNCEVNPFSLDNADVDADGVITIADVSTLIDMILTGNMNP